jgi:hypothetical protein
LGKGYDFDVINSDIILNRMSVKDGRLVLPDGMSYAMMLLPDQIHMPLEVLKKIGELVKAGATVVGPRPTTVPGLKDWENENIAMNQLADTLWGKLDGSGITENIYGKGRVFSGLTPDEVLEKMGVKPDFNYSGPSEIDYIHRTTKIGEIWFLRNESDTTVNSTCSFRVTDKFPEIWDPSTGAISQVTEYVNDDEGISFEISLPAHGSIFIVFTNEKRNEIQVFTDGRSEKETEISGHWTVTFPPNWGAPPSVVFDSLISWTESADNGIRYFSGTATYHNTFKVDEELQKEKLILDLGEMRDVAEVFVNGKSAGIIWKKPYQADISQLVKAGENELKIEVVNMWVNRLTGDMLSDPEDRYCKTNQTYMTKEVWPGGDEPFRLQTAGLLGPVTLMIRK